MWTCNKIQKIKMRLWFSSAVEDLPNMWEVLGSIHGTVNKRKQSKGSAHSTALLSQACPCALCYLFAPGPPKSGAQERNLHAQHHGREWRGRKRESLLVPFRSTNLLPLIWGWQQDTTDSPSPDLLALVLGRAYPQPCFHCSSIYPNTTQHSSRFPTSGPQLQRELPPPEGVFHYQSVQGVPLAWGARPEVKKILNYLGRFDPPPLHPLPTSDAQYLDSVGPTGSHWVPMPQLCMWQKWWASLWPDFPSPLAAWRRSLVLVLQQLGAIGSPGS
jgi:hypothetical protein